MGHIQFAADCPPRGGLRHDSIRELWSGAARCKRAGPWLPVNDELSIPPKVRFNLRRGYKPTGGLGEPFFRAERVALYNLLMPVGDDFFLRSLLV